MIGKKYKIIGILISFLLVTTTLAGCGEMKMRLEKDIYDFVEFIGRDDIDGLSLTIYYCNPNMFTWCPISLDQLINYAHDIIIVINSGELAKHIDLFKLVGSTDLVLVRKNTRIDARVYYVFEIENQGKLLDVAMWGKNGSYFINGVEIKENRLFYDIIRPFLPEDAVL